MALHEKSRHSQLCWDSRTTVDSLRIRQFEFSPDFDELVCAGTVNSHVVVANWTGTNRILGAVRNFGRSSSDAVLGLCWFRQNNARFLAGSSAGCIRIVDASHVTPQASGGATDTDFLHVPDLPVLHSFQPWSDLTCVHVNCDDSIALCSGYRHDVELLDLGTGRALRTLRDVANGHINITRFAQGHPHLFATSSFDKTVAFWDTRTDKRIFQLHSARPNVTLSFSADDTFLLTSAVDNEVRAYSVGSGRHYMRMDLPETGRPDNYTRAYFCPSFIPRFDDPRASLDPSALVISGSSEENVLRLSEVASGRLVASMNLYDGRKTEAAGVYIQSLRAHPIQPGIIGVLVGSRDPTVDLHMTIVDASRGTRQEVDRGTAGGSYAVDEENGTHASAIPLSSLPGTGSGPPPPAVRDMMMSMLILGVNEQAKLSESELEAYTEATTGASVSSVGMDTILCTRPWPTGTADGQQSSCHVPCHRGILLARHPGLSAVLAKESSRRMKNGMTCVHLDRSCGLSSHVLSTLLLWAYGNEFIPQPAPLTHAQREEVRAWNRCSVSVHWRNLVGYGAVELSASSTHGSPNMVLSTPMRCRAHRWEDGWPRQVRLGPLVQAVRNGAVEFSAARKAVFIHCKDMLLQDPPSVCLEARICKSDVGQGVGATAATPSTPVEWHSLCSTVDASSSTLCDRQVDLLSGVAVGLLAAQIGGSDGLAAAVIARVHPGADGQSELCPAMVVPLLALCCEAGARVQALTPWCARGDTVVDVEGLLTREGLLPRICWARQGVAGESTLAATALAVSVVAYCVQHYRHLAICGVLQSLDEAVGMSMQTSDGSDVARHKDKRFKMQPFGKTAADSGHALKEFASLIHSTYGAQQTGATGSVADAATRDGDRITVGPATASMHVGDANITLAVGQVQVRASSAALEAATSIMRDLTTAKSGNEGVASAHQSGIYGSTAQCPLRPYSPLRDPLFCDTGQAPQGVPCMFLHSANMANVHGSHRLLVLGGVGESSSSECNLQPQAPWVLDCGGKINAGVWSHEATSGPVPPALLKHSSVSLPGGRYVLVYPGYSTTSGDTGPGSQSWLSSGADKAIEAGPAAHPAGAARAGHRTVLSSILFEQHVSQQDRDRDSITVELPVIGAPPSAHPVGLQALVHSRVWILDTQTNEWACITPAWPDMSSSMQHLSWTLATSAEGKPSDSDSRQKIATRAGSHILALQSCTPCIPRDSHISALLEAPWCFPCVEQGAAGPGIEYFHMLTYGGFAVNPDPFLQKVSPSLDSGGRMMILRHLRMLIGTLTNSVATGRQQWSFEWATPSVAGVEPPVRIWPASCVLPMTIESPLHTCSPDNGPVMLMHGGMAATGSVLDDLWLLAVDGPVQACLMPGSSESSPRFAKNLAFRWHQVCQLGPACARSNHTVTSVWSILRGGATGQTVRQAINEDIARRTAILFGGQRPDSAQTSTIFTDKLMVLSITHEPPAAHSVREHGQYHGTWSAVNLTLSPGRGLRTDDEALPEARDLHTCTYAPLWPVRETAGATGQQPPAAAIAVPGPFAHPDSATAQPSSMQASMIMSARAYTKLEGRTVQQGWNVDVARLASSIPVATLLPGAFLVFGGFSDKRRVEQDGQSESSMYLRDTHFTLSEAVTTGILRKSSPFGHSVAAHLTRCLGPGHTGPATGGVESDDEDNFEDARGDVEAPIERGSDQEREAPAMDVQQDHEEHAVDDEGEEEGGGEGGDWGDPAMDEQDYLDQLQEDEEDEDEEVDEEEEEAVEDDHDDEGEDAPGPRAAQWRRGAGPPPDPDEWDEDAYRRRRHVDSILHALVLALAPAPATLVRYKAEPGAPGPLGRYADLLPALLQELSAAECEMLLYGLHETAGSVAYKARVQEAWQLVKAGRQREAAERLQPAARASAVAPERGVHPTSWGLELIAVGTWSRPPAQVVPHPGVRIPQGPAPLWANDLEKLLPTSIAPPAVQVAGNVLIQLAFLPTDSEGAYRTIPFLRTVLTARFPALAPMFVPSGIGGGSSSAYAEGQSGTLLLSQAPGLHAFRLVTGPVDDPQEDADLGYQVLLALLRWALTGGVEPTTSPEEAMALLAAADAWGASDAAVLAEAILVRHIGPDSVLGLLQYAEGYLAVQAAEGKGASLSTQVEHSGPGSLLRSACQSFILRNFRQVSSGPDWQLLPARLGAALEEQWRAGGHAFATDAGK